MQVTLYCIAHAHYHQSTIETWRSEARFYRFLVQSSVRHLLRFKDIQGRFTVSKSK